MTAPFVAGPLSLPVAGGVFCLFDAGVLAGQVARAEASSGIEEETAGGVVGGHEQHGVRPVDRVPGTVDEGQGRPDGPVEIGDAPDHGPEIVVVVGPVDVALLDDQEKAVGVAAEIIEGGVRRLGERRILLAARGDTGSAGGILHPGHLEIAALAPEEPEELPARSRGGRGAFDDGPAAVVAGRPLDKHIFAGRPGAYGRGTPRCIPSSD